VTAGELKKLLETVPDDVVILTEGFDHEFIVSDVKLINVNFSVEYDMYYERGSTVHPTDKEIDALLVY